jgi:hypothetical protein
MQKRTQTDCVFSGVSSPRVCVPRRIHGRDDSLKSNSHAAFPKNQPHSPPCPPESTAHLSPLPPPTPPRSVTPARSRVCRQSAPLARPHRDVALNAEHELRRATDFSKASPRCFHRNPAFLPTVPDSHRPLLAVRIDGPRGGVNWAFFLFSKLQCGI